MWELAPPYTGFPTDIAACVGSNTQWLDHDAIGDIFVDANGSLSVYDPPYTSQTATLSGFGTGGDEIAVDAAGDVFGCSSGSTMNEVQSPYTSAIALSGVDCGEYIRTSGSTLLVYPDVYDAPYTALSGTLSATVQAGRSAVAVSATGEIAVADQAGDNVAVYSSLTSSPVEITASGAYEVQFDSNGNLFVASSYTIAKYSPPFESTSTPVPPLLSEPGGAVYRIEVDEHGDLFAGTTAGLYVIPSGSINATQVPGPGATGEIDTMTMTP